MATVGTNFYDTWTVGHYSQMGNERDKYFAANIWDAILLSEL